MVYIRWQESIDLDGEVSAVINQGAPEFTALPPAFIGGVGSEYEEHGNGETQKGVENCQVFGVAGFPEFEVAGFQINYTPGIEAHQ